MGQFLCDPLFTLLTPTDDNQQYESKTSSSQVIVVDREQFDPTECFRFHSVCTHLDRLLGSRLLLP